MCCEFNNKKLRLYLTSFFNYPIFTLLIICLWLYSEILNAQLGFKSIQLCILKCNYLISGPVEYKDNTVIVLSTMTFIIYVKHRGTNTQLYRTQLSCPRLHDLKTCVLLLGPDNRQACLLFFQKVLMLFASGQAPVTASPRAQTTSVCLSSSLHKHD